MERTKDAAREARTEEGRRGLLAALRGLADRVRGLVAQAERHFDESAPGEPAAPDAAAGGPAAEEHAAP